MITIATLADEMVEGQRRAKGRKIRKIVAVCVDNFNILVADGSDPDSLFGRKFVGKLAHLAHCLKDYGFEDVDYARKKLIEFFEKFSGVALGDLSWEELDKKFSVPKRRSDASGILELYDALRAKGCGDSDESETGENDA